MQFFRAVFFTYDYFDNYLITSLKYISLLCVAVQVLGYVLMKTESYRIRFAYYPFISYGLQIMNI